MLPLITLEEHYLSQVVLPYVDANKSYKRHPPHFLTKLTSLGDERIQEMDRGEITLQVISHAPTTVRAPSPALCEEANNELAAAISKNPSRLLGFGMLPMCEPKLAAEELSRCVKELGFVGALLDNHLNGEFYDDEKFWPVFERAEELDVPLYLHPTYASDAMMEDYKGNYPESVAGALSSHGWGWHTETGLHFLKLWCAGVFDKFKGLKIVIGHMGEMLPFQLDRIVPMSRMWGERERGLRQCWRESVWVTTSGMFSSSPLRCLLDMTAEGHVLLSVDYPFSTNEQGRDFVEEVRKSGLMSQEQLEGFAHGNAEKLLKVKVNA